MVLSGRAREGPTAFYHIFISMDNSDKYTLHFPLSNHRL